MSEVRVCYDGKGGRCTIGRAISFGFFKVVTFIPWGELVDDPGAAPVTHLFPLRGYSRFDHRLLYGGWLRSKNSLMRRMFGTPGDWYSVYPLEAPHA